MYFPSFGYIYISCPSAEEGHDTRAEDDACGSINNLTDGGFSHLLVEEELVCKELNETSVEQDAGAKRVEDTSYDQRGGRIGAVGVADTQTGGNTNRSRKSVHNSTEDGHPSVRRREPEGGESGAQTESFEHLMKDDDDEEDLESFIDSKSEANDDGMEDDTEFEDNDGNDLSKRGRFVGVGVVNLRLGL